MADYITNQYGGWRFFKGQGRPIQLTSVTTATGATYAVSYAPSHDFGAGPRDAPRFVPVQVSLSGPDIPSAATSYLYANPRHAPSPFDPTEPESRGFELTWSWLQQPGAAVKVAQRTQWAVASHAFDGVPVEVAEGTFTDVAPSATNFATFRKTGYTHSARAPGNASCTVHTSEPPLAAYPGVVAVVTAEATQASVDGTTFISWRTRSCADVDDAGNILKTTVDPDRGYAGEEFVELASFDATATCRNCPVETKRTTLAGAVLANSRYRYDSSPGTWTSPLPEGKAGKGHLNYVSRWVSSGTVRWEVESAITYTAEGSVKSKVTDPFPGSHALSTTETYTYDLQSLRVTDTLTQDTGIALRKQVAYDPVHGWATQETGPFVDGGPAGAPTRAWERDAFGRVTRTYRAVTFLADGGVETGLEALSATEFVDWKTENGAQVPAMTVNTYAFLSPKQLLPGTSLDAPDVKQTVEYKDSLGRTVQVKERLGAPGVAAASSQVAQVLSGYRTVSHISYDLAGRVVASLEPYWTATGAKDGFETSAGIANIRGSLTRFDALGRATCASSGVYAAITSDLNCTSDPSNLANYRMSTRFGYRSASSAAGRLLAIGTVYPPSSDGVSGAVEAGYDGEGTLAVTTDAAGNSVTTTISALAASRTLTVTRQASGVPASAQTSQRVLDSMGRTLEETEDNWSPGATPSRRYTYDALGRAFIIELQPMLIGPWNLRPRLLTEWKSLGRKTKVVAHEPAVSSFGIGSTPRTLATYAYDLPNGGDTATYKYTAGHLTVVTSPLTTIALGYDEFGQQARRDQWIAGVATVAFTSTASSAADGRLLWSQFDSPWSKSVTTAVRYDSVGRPVQVDANDVNGLKLWQVRNDADTSYDGYDMQGRTKKVTSNNGKVRTVRHYSAFNGAMADQTTEFTSGTAIYKVASFGYQGTKLASLTDQTVSGSSTTVSYGYDPQGRLVSAAAVKAGTAALAQSYSESYRHGDESWPGGSSLGNLEGVTDASGSTGYAYVSDRVAEQHGAKAHLFQYDHAGRLVSRRPTSSNTTAAETEGYAWDVQDQLRKVRARVGGVSQVVEVIDYDPSGLPLFRRVGSVGTWYVGKMATVTATVSSSCGGAAACTPLDTPKVAVHQLLDGNRIATVRPPALAAGAGAFDEVLYYHRDYQGSVIGTSRRGAGVDGLAGAKYRYTPYGQLDRVEGVTAWTDSELGYTGGLRLGWVAGAVTTLSQPQAPGLVLLGARVYHAELKRWLVPDTVDPLRYTYTGGDPVNRVDPSGRIWLEYDKHKYGDPPPRLAEDFFIEQTMAYASQGSGSNDSGSSSGAAQGAGDQAPMVLVSADKVDATEPSGEDLNTEERSAATDDRRQQLIEAQDEVRSDPDFAPGGGKTHCNRATRATAEKVGAPTPPLDDLTTGAADYANKQGGMLAATSNTRFPGFYREVPPAEAQALANEGNLVIAVWINPKGNPGHSATVRPEGVPGDPASTGSSPLFNNIGGSRGVTRGAFGIHLKETRYYTPQYPFGPRSP